MCGICGIVGLEDRNIIKKMADSIAHRGPDDEGYFLNDDISLGHRRLSIIDLTQGHQPIHNEDQTLWIVFNGEIYNFQELRSDLEKKHHFYTNTDTEVIIHSYEEYGIDFIHKLRGMFAFALWDTIKKQLLLARDPIGKKPLYYYSDGHYFIFASEIKAILKAGIQKEVNIDFLPAFLAYGYSIGEQTLFRNIKKVLPGHYLIYKDNKIQSSSYWDINERIVNDPEHVIIAKLQQILKKSVEYRMISDVPIGAFLSGGMDSSSVVALCRPLIDYTFHTFTIGFETFSEFQYARIMSEYLDTEHHEIHLDSRMVEQNLEKIAWHYDEPLGDAAIINNFFLSAEAKKRVKVVIAGEGGDELFAGYINYKRKNKFRNFFNYPRLNNALWTCLWKSPAQFDLLKKYLDFFSQPDFDHAYLHSLRVFSDFELKSLITINPLTIDANAIFTRNIHHPINRMIVVDCKNLLPEKYLMKADKAIMANSVEERLPLLDKDFIDFSFTIPPFLKLKNGREKYILKMAMKDILPSVILNREKQGFGTPIEEWIRKGPISERVKQEFEDNELIKKIFYKDKIKKLTMDLKNKKGSFSEEIWTIFSLGLWFDIYFKTIGASGSEL